jgi:predicted TIM-barrel fold metal-dependent hydrolase
MRSPTPAEPPPLAAVGGAWDCHLHVFGHPARYPLPGRRRYTPGVATPADARAHAERIGAAHLLFVQASIYLDDNACMLDALAELGPAHRGVSVLPAAALDDRRLADFAAAGVRGVRLNPGGRIRELAQVADEVPALARRLAGTGWHLEVHCPVALAAPILDLATDAVPVVFDHMMGLDLGGAGFADDLETVAGLAAHPNVWVKLSVRSAPGGDPEANRAEAVRRLLAAAPERIVWGSDWPHTPWDGGHGFRAVDDRREASAMLALVGDAAGRVFRDSPARLFA